MGSQLLVATGIAVVCAALPITEWWRRRAVRSSSRPARRESQGWVSRSIVAEPAGSPRPARFYS